MIRQIPVASAALLLLTSILAGADATAPPQPGQLASSLSAEPHVIVMGVREERPKAGMHLWLASLAAVGASTSMDAATSWGKFEGNSVLASTDGRFGGKGLALKAALAGGIILPQVLLRRHRDLRKTFTLANLGAAALFSTATIHNLGVH